MPVSPPVIKTTWLLIPRSFVGPPETRRRFVGAKLREISLQALEERLKHIAL
jgi:hypothetical protein